MSRHPDPTLRAAALGYASRGIPVLPLHYPVTRLHAPRAADGGELARPEVATGCSCRDPGCAQVGKHPLGQLVPHGLAEATCNRARVLAWWTRHPQANIGLATGHTFDALDVDGPHGAHAIRVFAAQHGLVGSGPLVRTGSGWHYYLAPTGLGSPTPHGLEHVDWRGRGGYVVAPPSRHPSGRAYRWVRDLDQPLPEVPGPLRDRLDHRPDDRRAGAPVVRLPVGDGPGSRYARAALAAELARVAAAPQGRRNWQLWESGRDLFNLVADGALDAGEVERGLLAAAERSGLLAEEPRQTRRTLRSAREVGLAHPRHPPERTAPEPTPNDASPFPAARARGERTPERR